MPRPPRRPGHPYLAGAPLLMAHRGGSLLAPENTMAAFSQAVNDWGADVLEMDVRLTRDGRVVVIHDATVDRTTDGSGAVADMSWQELSALDAGFHFSDLRGRLSCRGDGVRVPLFEEVLATFPKVRLNVESKVAEAAGPLIDIIAHYRAEQRVLVAAEFETTRKGARGYEGPWGASRRHVAPFWALHRVPFASRLYRPEADAFQVHERSGPFRIVTRRFVQAAHAANIPVHVWTVNDEQDMRRLLDWGVDGIQSDRPDVLADVLVQVAGRAPAPCRRRGSD
ncbi:MAG: glycerophosphodiester phosphodiesterase [Longimicrobiales bacterium]